MSVESDVFTASELDAAPDPILPPRAAQSILAFTSPNGLIASTGNLYWTSTM